MNHTALFPNETFTLDAYKWASTIVSSRSIVVSTGNATVPLLVPFVDLAQHDHTANTTFEFDDDNNFKVITNNQVPQSINQSITTINHYPQHTLHPRSPGRREGTRSGNALTPITHPDR